ncbi:MAG: hypothetical protein AB8G05_02715 [Oligoflexales bacterium]
MNNYIRQLKAFVLIIIAADFTPMSIGLVQAESLDKEEVETLSKAEKSPEKADESKKISQDSGKPKELKKNAENYEDEEDFEFEPDKLSSDANSNAADGAKGTNESDAAYEDNPGKIADLEKDAKEAFSYDPYRSLNLLLSPGSEKLQAQGGSSNYSGSSQFLGVDLSLNFEPKLWKGFSLQFFIHFHEFITTNFIRVRSDRGSMSTDTLRFQRSNFGITLQKNVFQFEHAHRFYVNLGIFASQLPILETASYSIGATKLDSFYYTGVTTGGAYEFFWSERGKLFLNAHYLARSFNSRKTIERILLTLGVKYRLVDKLFLRTSVRWVKESADYNLYCPDDQAVNCSTKGKVESLLSYGQLGIGVDF